MIDKPTTGVDQPIQDFSDCHQGIFGVLDELAALSLQQGGAAQRQEAARRILKFFREVVTVHHREEEAELFSAVLSDAQAGDERLKVQALIARLTDEHQRLEALYANVAPILSAIEHGQDVALDNATVSTLVADYREHARFEEAVFLPLAQSILQRDRNHMAALGLALHIRHASGDIRQKYGFV